MSHSPRAIWCLSIFAGWTLDQIKSIDRRRRIMRLIDTVPAEALVGYRERLAILLRLPNSNEH